jgi:hypothetical protein
MTRQWRAGDGQDILHAPLHGVQLDEREGEVPVRRAAEGGVRLGHGGLHSEAGGACDNRTRAPSAGSSLTAHWSAAGVRPVALRFVWGPTLPYPPVRGLQECADRSRRLGDVREELSQGVPHR